MVQKFLKKSHKNFPHPWQGEDKSSTLMGFSTINHPFGEVYQLTEVIPFLGSLACHWPHSLPEASVKFRSDRMNRD